MLQRNILPLSFFIQACALLVLTASPIDTFAQGFPSTCKPSGANNCVAKIPGQFTYEARLCSGRDFFDSEAEAAAHYIDISQVDQPTPWCAAPVITPLGYADGHYIKNGAQPDGFAAACVGTNYGPYPLERGNYDIKNFSLYGVTRYINGSACDVDYYEVGMVQRERELYCPEGYGAGALSAYCVRSDNKTDVGKNLGCPEEKGQCTVGNPINVGVGNKYQAEADFALGGPNPIRFARYYNSFAGRSTSANGMYRFGQNGPDSLLTGQNPETDSSIKAIAPDTIGVNWRHTYHRAVVRFGLADVHTASVYRQDGQILVFNRYNGEWVPDLDVDYKLVELTDSSGTIGWELTTPSDDLETYRADGKLQTIADRNGVTQTLAYDSLDRLASVTGHFGHVLTFDYAADLPSGSAWWEAPTVDARITSMTDSAGNVYSYDYDTEGNLTKVTYPDLTDRKYRYQDSSFPYALTAIIDENDDQFATFEYDSNGRAVVSYHGVGADVVERVDINYTSNSSDPIYGQDGAVVTFAQGTAAQTTRSTSFARKLGVSKLTSETQGGATKSYSYDANGNVDQETDLSGTTTDRTFDLTRNLETSRTEAVGTPIARTITTAWHPDYRLPEFITLPSVYGSGSYTIDYRYFTGTPNVQKIIEEGYEPNGSSVRRVTWFTYDSDGQLLSIDGPRSGFVDRVKFRYHECVSGGKCGMLRKVFNPYNQATTYNTYDANGNITQMTSPDGVKTFYKYDLRNRPTKIRIQPNTGASRITWLTYDDAGQLETVETPNGQTLIFAYDTAHKLRSVTDNLGNRIEYTYDGRGNRDGEDTYDPSSALKRAVDYVFDTFDRLDTISAGGFVTDLDFDPVGNLTDETDPELATTQHAYDPLDRLESTIDALTGAILYGYDVHDNLTSVTAANGTNTTYEYDDFGNLLKEISPDRGTSIYTYDEAGNRLTTTDARNKLTTYDYDGLNRVDLITLDGGGTIDYVYPSATTAVSRLQQIVDATGNTTWSYNDFGEVTQKVQTIGSVSLTVEYGYDSNGRMTSLTLPSGKVVTYGYTSFQPTSVLVDATTVLSSATYEPFGPVSAWTWGNASASSRSYDLRGLVNNHTLAGDTRTLGYDGTGRVTSRTDLRHTDTFGYDDLGRLEDLQHAGIAPLPTSQAIDYDGNGNRTGLTENGTFYSYMPIASTNRLMSVAGPATKSYSYDAAGNITGDGIHTYAYDDRGRLVNLDSGVALYDYDGLGQRVKKDAGSTTLYVYDESGRLLGEYDGSGNAVVEHVWFDGSPVAALGTSSISYVHTDHLGTPRAVTNSNTTIWRWESDPFGKTAAQQDPDGDSIDFVYNLRFPGQYYDSESGHHYNYFRTYDPSTGRYLESDPIGLAAGLNTYAYVGNLPTTYVDPFGLDRLPSSYPVSHPDYYHGPKGDYYDTTGRPRPEPGPGAQVGVGASACAFGLCASRDFILDEYARRELSSSTLESGATLFVCFNINESECETSSEDDIRDLGWGFGLGRRLGFSKAPGEYCINLGLGIGLPVEKPTDLGPIT